MENKRKKKEKVYYDEKGNVTGYSTRTIWGSTTYYDADHNVITESKKSFLRAPNNRDE